MPGKANPYNSARLQALPRSVLEQRRLHPFFCLAVVNDGPAVVLPSLDDIYFVSPAGPSLPEGPCSV